MKLLNPKNERIMNKDMNKNELLTKSSNKYKGLFAAVNTLL